KNSISKEQDRGILNKIISNSLKKNSTIKVYGDGKYLRDFIFIDDLIELFILIIRKQGIFYDQTLNVNSIEKTYLKDFFINLQKNLKILGVKKKITYSKWPSDAMAINKRSFQVSNKTIYKKYKWKPKIQLLDGILKSLNYYEKKNNS
ncbi:NAD-dependent epimerase/dehydratase family protein, partial [bacterium]|nr:NAD-dependent epimerase/dehydratase family protein [bacterium]